MIRLAECGGGGARGGTGGRGGSPNCPQGVANGAKEGADAWDMFGSFCLPNGVLDHLMTVSLFDSGVLGASLKFGNTSELL